MLGNGSVTLNQTTKKTKDKILDVGQVTFRNKMESISLKSIGKSEHLNRKSFRRAKVNIVRSKGDLSSITRGRGRAHAKCSLMSTVTH